MGFNKTEKEIIKLINKGKIFDFPSFVKHYYSDSKVLLNKSKIESILKGKFNKEMFEEICTKLDTDELKCEEDLTPDDMPEGASCFMGGYKIRKFTNDEKEIIKELLQNPKIPRGRYNIKISFDTPFDVDLLDNEIYLIEDTCKLENFRNVIHSLKKLDLGIISEVSPNAEIAYCCLKRRIIKKNDNVFPFFSSFETSIDKHYILDKMYGHFKYISDTEKLEVNDSLIEEFKDVMQINIKSDYSLDNFVKKGFCTSEDHHPKKANLIAFIAVIISLITIIVPILVKFFFK